MNLVYKCAKLIYEDDARKNKSADATNLQKTM